MSAASSLMMPGHMEDPPSTPKRHQAARMMIVSPLPPCLGALTPGRTTPRRAPWKGLASHALTEEFPEPVFATPPRRVPTKLMQQSMSTARSTSTLPSTPDFPTTGWKTSGGETSGLQTRDGTSGIGFGGTESSPDVTRRSKTTPPLRSVSAPQGQLQEVQAALRSNSAKLLSAALLRSHSCCAEHCIHEAVKLQHLVALDFLLSRSDADVDEPCCGRRPLHVAIETSMRRGDRSYVLAERLLEHGASPDVSAVDEPRRVEGPLSNVARRGHAAGAALLLAYGADPSHADVDGGAPLHTVAQHASVFTGAGDGGGHADVARLLLRHGACPFQLDADGRKASAYAFGGEVADVLRSAEQWWNKRALALALTKHGALSAVATLQLPEIFDAVGRFL